MVFEARAQVAPARAFAGLGLIVAGDAMARVTEMCVAPAEPECNRTAELALEVYVICAVLLAVFYTSANAHGRTLCAHELFRLVVLLFLLASVAIFHSSEVGRFTFETHVVRALEHRVTLKIVVVIIIWILKLFIFVETLNLGPLKRLLLDHVF